MAAQKRFELSPGHGPHLLCGDGAATEKQEGRNAADVELRGRLRVLVDIELDHAQAALVLAGDLVEQRSDHLARTTPFGPEIEQYGLLGSDDIGLEIGICRMYDLVTHVSLPLVLVLPHYRARVRVSKLESQPSTSERKVTELGRSGTMSLLVAFVEARGILWVSGKASVLA